MAKTYAQLQADVASWAVRDDVGAIVPICITLVQDEIARLVRVLEQETDDTLECTQANGFAADLPDGFLGFKHVYVADASNPNTQYLPPQQFHELNLAPRDGFNSVLGKSALIYTVEANKIKVDAPTGSPDTITLDVCYLARFADISEANPTGYLLTNHYDLFLWGALKELWDWIDEMEMVAKYQARFDRVVHQITAQEVSKRQAAGPMVRRPPEVVA